MIRCFDDAHVLEKYSQKNLAYKQAMESCVVSRENKQTCFESDSDGWREAISQSPHKPKPEHKLGPGQILSKFIKLITGAEPGPNCQCKKRAMKMDEWGWVGCIKHRHTIIQWLCEEAENRGHKMTKKDVRALFFALYKEIR